MSNSRVESHNRAELRNRIISAATLLEILQIGRASCRERV